MISGSGAYDYHDNCKQILRLSYIKRVINISSELGIKSQFLFGPVQQEKRHI